MRNFNEHQESLDALIASTSAYTVAAYTAATHTAATLILQFGDESCAPCHAIRHKLDAWLANHPDVAARYIDIQTHLALCSQMGIMSAPTVIVYMDGKVVAREAGYFSLDDMLARVERYLEMRG